MIFRPVFISIINYFIPTSLDLDHNFTNWNESVSEQFLTIKVYKLELNLLICFEAIGIK